MDITAPLALGTEPAHTAGEELAARSPKPSAVRPSIQAAANAVLARKRVADMGRKFCWRELH